MSAPDTNTKKQEERHKVPLMGMKGIVVIAALGLIALVFYTVLQSPGADDETTIEMTPSVQGTGDAVIEGQ